MVSWTCQRVVLNWPMFRSRGVSRFRDATVRSRAPGDGNISPWCVPGRQSAASFALYVSQKVPRTGKAPLPGNISLPCIQNELTLARFARHVSEMPCKLPFGNTPREDLATKGVFSLHRPLESCTTRESCHSWVFRLGVAGGVRGEAGRGVLAQRMRLAHAPALCEAARCFRGFISCSFELPPLARTMLLLLRLLSRETCSLPPCEVCVHSASSPTRGKRIRLASLGMSRLAVHAPFALRVRFAAARVVDLVGISHEAGTRISVVASATRPKQRDRVVYRRKRGAVMVFR